MVKKVILIAIIATLSTFCSSENDYSGVWKNGETYAVIRKAGDKGFFIKYNSGNSYSEPQTIYCTFEEGCFIIKQNNRILLCSRESGKLIDLNGKILERTK